MDKDKEEDKAPEWAEIFESFFAGLEEKNKKIEGVTSLPGMEDNEAMSNMLAVIASVEALVDLFVQQLEFFAKDRRLIKAVAAIYRASYEELMEAGFNEDQAMAITLQLKSVATESMQNAFK